MNEKTTRAFDSIYERETKKKNFTGLEMKEERCEKQSQCFQLTSMVHEEATKRKTLFELKHFIEGGKQETKRLLLSPLLQHSHTPSVAGIERIVRSYYGRECVAEYRLAIRHVVVFPSILHIMNV